MSIQPIVSMSTFLNRVDEELIDPVSLEPMAEPVVLFCGHTLSEGIARQLLARPDHRCPSCRAPFENFVPNYTIRNIAEARQTMRQAPAQDPSEVGPPVPRRRLRNAPRVRQIDVRAMEEFLNRRGLISKSKWNRNRGQAEYLATSILPIYLKHNEKLGGGSYTISPQLAKEATRLCAKYSKGSAGKAWDGFVNFLCLNGVGHAETCELRNMIGQVREANQAAIRVLKQK